MKLKEEIKQIVAYFHLNEKEQDELYKKIKEIIRNYKNEKNKKSKKVK